MSKGYWITLGILAALVAVSMIMKTDASAGGKTSYFNKFVLGK